MPIVVPSDALYPNHFVARGDPRYLLTEDDIHELRIKKPDGTHASFNCDHQVMMEILDKYGLKPKWSVWIQQEVTKKDGTVVTKKDGTPMTKLVEIPVDDPRAKEKLAK